MFGSVVYRETIPSMVPPSYKGQAVRYAYKVTIGAQKVNALTRLLRIPIKVFVVEGEPQGSRGFCRTCRLGELHVPLVVRSAYPDMGYVTWLTLFHVGF